MSQEGLKLTSYFGERSRVRGRLVADELLDIHARHAVRSSILMRGVQGFGAKHRLRSDRLLTLSEDLPLVCVAVDTRERIERLLEEVGAIEHEGLLTLERAQLYGAGEAGEPSRPAVGGHDALTTDWHDAPGLGSLSDTASSAPNPVRTLKLTVYLGRHERVNGTPAFAAVCQALHEDGVAGATVLLGVDGTRHGERERARFFAGNANVPLMVVSVGERRQIDAAIRHLDQLLKEPLFTVEGVRVCKRDGQFLERPHDESTAAEYGMDVRQKLTVIASEAAVLGKSSVYLELVRRLRGANAAGATSLRGIWGFHGDHAPHGDRLLSIRRHVPVLTDTIDTPRRIAELFPIVDELTRESGLVTSELLPASEAIHTVPRL